MAASASNMPSSMLISMICAPLSTCWRATSSASPYFSSFISRLKRAEPVTLVRSPTFTNRVLASIVSGSSPAKRQATGISGNGRGGTPATALTIAAICRGVVPQQPPTIFKIRHVPTRQSAQPSLWLPDHIHQKHSANRHSGAH